MKNCKKCNASFIPSKGLLNFCSFDCKYDRKNISVNERCSIELKKRWGVLSSDDIQKNKSKFHTQERAEKMAILYKEKFKNRPWDDLGIDGRRRRVIEEQNGACNRCGLSEWLGEKLTLEMDHKDGFSENNKRENLECLCPNCHSLTPTWRGRNKRSSSKKKTISDAEISEALTIFNNNIRQSLLYVGLAAKGGNYKRAKRLIASRGSLTQLAE